MPIEIDRSEKKETSSSKDKVKHIQLCLEKEVENSQTTGFENYYLLNNPLPEMDFHEIDISCTFIGKKISAPFIISPMSGGSSLSTKINRNLAKAAHSLGVVMSVGSQRLGLENPSLVPSYQVRQFAPDVPLLANLGAIYLNYGYGLKECEEAVNMIGADALVLYLNPLQKILQGSSKLNFKGLVNKISNICRHLSVPVIVKEVGFGICYDQALILKEAGVKLLDVAGAGGTSWVKITKYLKNGFSDESISCFDNWGIPTADTLVSVCKAANGFPIIASGGIRSGIDMFKALTLGAHYIGMALPLLAPAMRSAEAVEEKIKSTIEELKVAMFCCGVSNLTQLRKGDYIRKL